MKKGLIIIIIMVLLIGSLSGCTLLWDVGDKTTISGKLIDVKLVDEHIVNIVFEDHRTRDFYRNSHNLDGVDDSYATLLPYIGQHVTLTIAFEKRNARYVLFSVEKTEE